LGGILSFAQEGIDFIRGPLVQRAVEKSTFSLDDVTRGAPLAIYIVLPPSMLESHGRLLRLWISVLIAAILRRRRRPDLSTLFILDEAAQLGALSQLRQALTLLRGYGLQTWSFWQDATQLHQLYPTDWQTMVNNCRVLQAFGANNRVAAQSMSDLVGFDGADNVLDLGPDEMLLQIAGDEAIVAKRPDYRNDPAFAGMFDANPLYDATLDPLPPPRPPLRFYLRPHRTSEERTETDDAVDSDLARRLIEMGKGRK
jgi:type IV secretion system protein VirD4